jgi:(1->4)-alpha-D-glucan 1-alpha-D-glucosylmutase
MPPTIPLATYRLQLSKDFGFDDAARLVPYLKALGVTHLYASPFLAARPGSDHGYDVVDHNTLNPEFGGDEAFAHLSDALKDADLGLILDFVPNHMAVGASNAWWLDVLEWGAKSPHAASFDIAWELLPYRRGGGVLLPVLGRSYGEALTAGEIELKFDPQAGSFSAWYFDHRFPINPQRFSDILKTVVAAAHAAEQPAGHALLALAAAYGTPGAPSYSQAPELKQRLAAEPGAAAIIGRGLVAYRADGENGVNLLHRLLERQHYRLAYWRLAPSGINYRRFFDINELAGLRVEDMGTFRAIHRLVGKLIATGQLHGLRLDHIDGLYNPLQYTVRLQQFIRNAQGRSARRDRPFHVTVEKILEEGEHLPPFSGIAGTTGYEWLTCLSRLMVNEDGRRKLGALWRSVAPELGDFASVLEDAKLRVLDTIMASEFNVLAQLLARIAAGHYSTRDYAADRLREALKLYVIEFPIYRTYVTSAGCSDTDRVTIGRTIDAARRRWPGPDADIFDFLHDAITLDLIPDPRGYSSTRLRQFALKLQQFTGPMMAKSLEDTALYRYHALLGLNEVGGEPTLPGLSAQDFHERMGRRARHFTHGLTATATHDTKRGEDARMRILALSDIPDLWAEHVARWRAMNAGFVIEFHDRRSPSASHEYMIYQALIGAWPQTPVDGDFIARIEQYAIKAAHEGKLETNWINPDETYEAGLKSFIHAILDASRTGAFLESFAAFARRTALLGALGSLSQLTLKATMPGVPDFYQGTEFWDLSLVDPDNRRPVDFAARYEALTGEPHWDELAARWPDGHIKLALTQRLLRLRQSHSALFEQGGYEPVGVSGPDSNRTVAFMRTHRTGRLLVVAARHFSPQTGDGEHWPRGNWQARLELDENQWRGLRDALGSQSGAPGTPDVARLLGPLPVAVMAGGPAGSHD